MKKHKSVVAILLSVMMIFTMMPMMAFAADSTPVDGEWLDNYSKVKVNGVEYAATRTWNEDGTITAAIDTANMSSSAIAKLPNVKSVKYYDLTNAVLYVNGVSTTKYTAAEFDSVFPETQANKVVLVQPTYVTNYKAGTKTAAKALTGWNVNVEKPAFDKTSTADQTFTVFATIALSNPQEAADGQAVPFKIEPAALSATLTFVGTPKNSASAAFYFDKVDKETALTKSLKVPYDGASHTIVMDEIPGYSVTYQVLNKNTGAYEAGTPSVKNVADSVTFKATVTNGKTGTGNTDEYVRTIGVSPAKAPTFGFITDKAGDETADYKVKEGTKYDVYSYVAITPDKDYKAAVKADEATWMAYFKDYYEVTETPGKLDASKIDLAISKKVQDTTALDKQYKDFLSNYSNKEGLGVVNATLEIVAAEDWYEIEFVNTPTSKVYKAKVLKKKAKSFKVKAVATNGEAVNYKLINAPGKIVINKTTGKITLKKGLKKGTYKIQVKAYIPKSFGEGVTWPAEYHQIVIKVKK